MAQTEFDGPDEVRGAVGRELGASAWLDVTQELVNDFADATGDHQWIHVDVERAKDTPFGGTIAHGLLTLSLGPRFMEEIMGAQGFAMGINYGYNRVRFTSPLPVGSRLRMHATLASVEDVPGGLQLTVTHTYEREGQEKPVCVAESVMRLYEG